MTKQRALDVGIAIAAALWLTLSGMTFATALHSARIMDATSEIWSDGPGRSGMTAEEAELERFEYRTKATDTRTHALVQLERDILLALVVWLLIKEGRRKRAAREMDRKPLTS